MRIQTWITSAIIVVVAVVNVVYAVYVVNRERQQGLAQLQVIMEENNKLLKVVTAGPLYDGNVEQLDAILDSIFSNPDIVRIELIEYNGDIKRSRNRPPVAGGGRLVDRQVVILWGIDTLGEIRTTYSTARIQQLYMASAKSLSLFALVMLLLLSIVIYLVARRISRPIERLTVSARDMADGHLDREIRTGGVRELQTLGQSFIRMRDAIREKMTDLAARNTALLRTQFSIDRAKDAIFWIMPDGRFVYVNQAACTSLGYSREELLSLAVYDIDPQFPQERWQAHWEETRNRGSDTIETMHRTKDGRVFPVEVSIYSMSFEGEEFHCAFARDITERKRAEEEIIHLNRVYALLSNVNQAIVRIRDRQALLDEICRVAVEDGGFRMAWIGFLDEETRKVSVAAQHGGSGNYLAGLNIIVSDAPESEGPTSMAIRSGTHSICNDIEQDEIMAPWRDQAIDLGYRALVSFPLKVFGKTIATLNIYSAVKDFFKDQEIRLLDELAADISFAFEFMEREEEQQKLVSVIEASADLIGIADLEGNLLYLNKAGMKLVGIDDLEEVRNKTISRFHQEEDYHKLETEILPSIQEKGVWNGEMSYRHFKTGVSVPVDMNAFVISDMKSGRAIALANISRDISERKQAQEALRHSEEQYRLVVENANDAIFIAQDERIKFPNAALEKLLEYSREEMSAKAIGDFIHPDDRQMVLGRHVRRLQGEVVPQMYEFRLLTRSGVIRWVELNAVLIGWEGRPATLNFLRDITQQKKLEQQFLQAQKMEAVGKLAGGIAHDFNNILTAIIGYGNLVLMKSKADKETRAHVDEILAAAERAAVLTRSLLAFSRKQIINPRPVSVNKIIDQVRKLLQRVIGEDIELRIELTEQNLEVLADSGQIEQVLINLATNARDAMPAGGRLSLETGIADIDEEYIRYHGYGQVGRYALITVSDTGEGMEESTRQRVFEPFFTTKEVGKGTGLGLAMVYGSVKQHKGYINVYSELGQGTTFKLYLPVVLAGEAVPADLETKEAPHGGKEFILLAEDDEAVRELTKNILEEFGYTVIEAADGREAVEKLESYKDRIDLLIVDVVMPKKNGKEVFEEAQRMKPGVKVLFTSGYPFEVIQKKTDLTDSQAFISKPVTPYDLLRKIREVLDQ